MTTGVLARAALTASIYKRGVRLTGKARTTLTNSDILNHVSTDVCAFTWLSFSRPDIPSNGTVKVSRIDVCAQWFVSTRFFPETLRRRG